MKRATRSRRRVTTALCIALGTSVFATACRDTLGDGAVNPLPRSQTGAQLRITPARDGDSVVTVDVRVTGFDAFGASSNAPPKIVSLTAAVEYDSTRFRYLNDVSPSDGALRAMHAARGRLMIAAAHATGFTSDVFARVRFVQRGATASTSTPRDAYSSFALQLTELHLSDATDVRERTTVLPVAVIK